jgi:hypothetical protein
MNSEEGRRKKEGGSEKTMAKARVITFLCSAVALCLIARTPQAADERPLAVEAIATPAGPNSSSPQLTVDGDRAILSWIERAGKQASLKFAERTASGWSEPKIVVSSEHLMVNSADVPSVRALPDGTLAAHWMQENGPDPEAYDLRVAWSPDGRTWTPAVAPNRDKTISQHGFATLFPLAGGGMGMIWLDGRTTHGDEGDMQLRAAAFDKTHKQLSDTVIDSRVCECCQTSVALAAEGPVAAFRDRSAAEIRDIYVTRLAGGRWSMPVPVHRDNFKIEGCPVNGPAIAARDKDVVVAWFTAPKGINRSYLAFSHDGGRTFGAPVRADDVESLGRVVVALKKDGSAVVGWVESATQTPQFQIRRVQPNGTRSAAVTVANQSGTRYPRMALVRDEVVLAWTESEQESSRVKTARARVD